MLQRSGEIGESLIRRMAEEKTRKEGEHLDLEPLEGDKLKLTYKSATSILCSESLGSYFDPSLSAASFFFVFAFLFCCLVCLATCFFSPSLSPLLRHGQNKSSLFPSSRHYQALHVPTRLGQPSDIRPCRGCQLGATADPRRGPPLQLT